MLKKLITVVICTYNRVDLLSICIKSLINQTADKNLFEILVVNNNSTDDTIKVVKIFKKNNTEIKLRIINENKQGLSHARNKGWKEAEGKYVAYIDDDSIANVDWIEKINKFIIKHQDVEIFGGPYSYYYFKPMPEWYPKEQHTFYLGKKIMRLNASGWLSGTNMIYQKKIFYKYGGFDKNLGMRGEELFYGEETEFQKKLKNNGIAIYYIPEIKVKHLIAEYKKNMIWMLRSDYLRGYSFAYIKKKKKYIIKAILYLVFSIIIFPLHLLYPKKLFKKRLYYGLSDIFSSLGKIRGSVRLVNYKNINEK